MGATAVRDESGAIIGYNDEFGNFIPAKVTKYAPTDTSVSVFDKTSVPPTFGDIRRAEKQGNERTAVAAGIGALGTGAQIAAAVIPNAADIENKKRLSALAKHKGLDAGTRAEIDEQASRGVRALAGEQSQRAGDLMAASPGHSAEAIHRARLTDKEALNKASIEAADIGIRENRAQVQRDVQEEQDRINYKANRENEIKGLVARAIATGVMETARPLAAGLVKGEPTDAQLLAMRDAKDASGNYLYPGLQDATDAEGIRRLYRQALKDAKKGDNATTMR